MVTRQSFGTFAKPANGWARTVFVAMLTRRADLAWIEVLEVWTGIPIEDFAFDAPGA